MGWELVPSGQSYAGRTQFYTFTRSINNPEIRNSTVGYTKKTNPGHWSWQSGNLWLADEVCIRWVNDTESPFIFKHMQICTCACNSGGRSFWAWGGQMPPCGGWGGVYYCYVRVSNDGVNYTASDVARSSVGDITTSNMLSPGRSPGTGANSASFYADWSDPDNFRNFDIVNSPIIQPGGSAYVHIAAESISGGTGYTSVMKFNLDVDVIEATIEPAEEKVVWQFQEDGKWHLIPDFFTNFDNGWKNNK